MMGRYEWFDDVHDEIYNSDGCNDINSVDYNIEESDDDDDDDDNYTSKMQWSSDL